MASSVDMKKILHSLRAMWTPDVPVEDRKAVAAAIARANLTRTRVLAWTVIAVNMVTFAFVYAYLGKINAHADNYVGVSLLGVRVFLSCASGLYLAVSVKPAGDVPRRVQVYGFLFIAALLVSLALHSGIFQALRPLVVPYLIGVITVAVCIYLSGAQCPALFGGAWIAMAASLVAFQPDVGLLASNLAHVTAMTIAAVAVSRMTYTSKIRELLYLRRIESQNRELERLSLTDKLTGLANRRLMDRHLAAEWRRCFRQGLPLSVIMLDIDHFKNFNDTYGHARGDDCLEYVAHAIREKAGRAGDLAARYGGEEFAVILSDTDKAGVLSLAESLRSGVEALAIPHDNTQCGVVTVSIGCATTDPAAPLETKTLLEKADTALYKAKTGGRNRVEA